MELYPNSVENSSPSQKQVWLRMQDLFSAYSIPILNVERQDAAQEYVNKKKKLTIVTKCY